MHTKVILHSHGGPWERGPNGKAWIGGVLLSSLLGGALGWHIGARYHDVVTDVVVGLAGGALTVLLPMMWKYERGMKRGSLDQ